MLVNLERRAKNYNMTSRLQPRLAIDLYRQLLKHLDPNLCKQTPCMRYNRYNTVIIPGVHETIPMPVLPCVCRYSITHLYFGLQCFDTIGWVLERASGLYKLSDEVLAWLYV